MLKWWLAAYWTGQEYLWIGPVSYIWDNGRKAAVENSREGRSNGILLVKIGNAWKIRLTMQCCNAVSIPKSIAEKNTKATMICVGYLFIGRDKIADMRYRIEYIVRFKNIGSCNWKSENRNVRSNGQGGLLTKSGFLRLFEKESCRMRQNGLDTWKTSH